LRRSPGIFPSVPEPAPPQALEEATALDERIAGMLATTAAGIAAQVTLLATYGGLQVRDIGADDVMARVSDGLMARLFASINTGVWALGSKESGDSGSQQKPAVIGFGEPEEEDAACERRRRFST
jgi:hypothetical protein